MKKNNGIAAALLLGALCLLFLCSCGMEKESEPTLYVTVGGEENAQETSIRWTKNANGEYYLFLPSASDENAVRIWAQGGRNVSVNGRDMSKNGAEDFRFFSGTYDVRIDGEDFSLNVIVSGNTGALFICTESGGLDAVHADKEYKESGSAVLYENGMVTGKSELSYIKGRGNATWTGEKRPYNIKFADKLSPFGMEAAKKWCLIANAFDETLLRNALALELARDIGIPGAVDCRPADLYINGDYRGSYLVCEKIEVGKNRVDITDLDKRNEEADPGADPDAYERMESGSTERDNKRWSDMPAVPGDVSGGYLIEYDCENYYAEERNGFITAGGQYVTVKSPDPASKAEIDYISRYCSEAEDALRSADGYNALGKHYSEYYDVPALAKMYVLQEYLMNADACFSSCYFYKDAGGKLTAGPAWDFDASMRPEYNYMNKPLFEYSKWCTHIMPVNRYTMLGSVYNLAIRHADFREEVRKQWKDCKAVFAPESLAERIGLLAEELKYSAAADHYRWNTRFLTTAEEWTQIFLNRTKQLTDFADLRFPYMEKGFSEDAAYLFYDFQGVYGFAFNENINTVGDCVVVKDVYGIEQATYTLPDGVEFLSWNTEPDGSGKSYLPGDEITLSAPETILYAQWNKQ